MDTLIQGRFLVDNDINEKNTLKLRYMNYKYDNKLLKICLIPTYNCNLSCSYCYQKQLDDVGFDYGNENISKKMLDSLEDYLRGATINRKKLHIEWFGGEPLLVSDLLINFNYKMKKICEANDCFYSSSLVTNGYLLNKKLAKRIYKSGTQGALITVDGPKDIHNNRRCLKNGEGTYEKIIKNIIEISDFFKINIRTNIDKENIDHIKTFIHE